MSPKAWCPTTALSSWPHTSVLPPQDTLRDCDQESTCYNTVISPIYFVSFVLTAQFVLVNVVIAVLMKHLEESNKEAKEEAELEAELELEMKTLSPQPHSPLGSPFLWPGVQGPDSPDSPKSRAPYKAAHSLEHPTVSPQHPCESRRCGEGGRQLSGLGANPGLPLGPLGAEGPAAQTARSPSAKWPQTCWPSVPCSSSLVWPPFPAPRFKAKFSVSFLFLSYPCPMANLSPALL